MMDWVSDYQLFLFDLDGLLVNTEEMHDRAYIDATQKLGLTLEWDFPTYFRYAQTDSETVKNHILALFKEKKLPVPFWEDLYKDKKHAYTSILKQEPVPLLPGVKEFLTILQEKNRKQCVVTHSSRDLVELIKRQHKELISIPFWICREDYEMPKPSPECYEKAIQTFAKKSDAVIGFEDSTRGMNALMATRATAVLVNGMDEEVRAYFAKEQIPVFSSFNEILVDIRHALKKGP
jgi:beta-phosphoglucomutase